MRSGENNDGAISPVAVSHRAALHGSGQQAFLDITVTAVAFGQLRKQRRRRLADPERCGPRRYRPCVCAARLRDRPIVAGGKIIVTIDFIQNEMITLLS